jgi:hypothetical protein
MPDTEAMSSQGESTSWQAQKANQVAVANEFLAQLTGDFKDTAGSDFEQMPETVACSEEFYAKMATFLCYTYRIKKGHKNAGKFLDEESAIPLLSGLINQAKARFSKLPTLDESRVRMLLRVSNACGLLADHYPLVCVLAEILKLPQRRQLGAVHLVEGPQGQDEPHYHPSQDGVW